MTAFKPFAYKTVDAFKADLQTYSPGIPYTDDLSPLARPLTCSGKTVPNRIAVHPMEGADGNPDGSPGELTIRRYRRFAQGGAGLLWFEATAVVPEGRANPRQLHINPGNADAFKRLLEDALEHSRRAGNPRPFTVLQLTHSGRQSKPGPEAQPIIACPSPLLDRKPGRVISDDELERLRDRFVDAAAMAAAAGFDAIDIKACHGYLLGELLAAHNRPGKFGGSFENRTRFMLETVEAIQARLGNAAVLASRFGVWDCVPLPDGWGVDAADYHIPDFSEPIALAAMLHQRGVAIFDITCGNPYFNPHVNRPFDRGFYTPPRNQMENAALLLEAGKALQAAVPEALVIGTGLSWYRHFGANIAAAAVRDGWFAMAGFGRQAFAYPDFAADILRNNALEPAKCCVACGNCTQIMRDGGTAGCMVRDREVYLPIYREGRNGKPPVDMSRVAEHIPV